VEILDYKGPKTWLQIGINLGPQHFPLILFCPIESGGQQWSILIWFMKAISQGFNKHLKTFVTKGIKVSFQKN